MGLLDVLKPNRGSTHSRKRLGRGDSSGHGGTSGKGHKGQKARSGGKVRRGFEGGQTPLSRRLPKLGFKNTQWASDRGIVNLRDLNRFDGTVNAEVLKAANLINSTTFKVLGKGELSKKLTVIANAVSPSAKEAIEKAGGKIELIAAPTEASVKAQAKRGATKKSRAANLAARAKKTKTAKA